MIFLVSVGSLFVDHHNEHQRHRVIDAFVTIVSAWMVGAGGDIVDTEAFVESEGDFRAKLESTVGKGDNGTSPEMDIRIDEDVGGA